MKNKNKKFELNNYRSKKIGDKYFIASDHGSNLLLSENDYNAFKTEKIRGKLFDILEDNGFIITKKNEQKVIQKTKERYSFLFAGTSLHIIVPTLRCNMKCLYCQTSSVSPDLKQYNMNKVTAKKTVEFIFQSPSKDIRIEYQGGEPLLNFEIIKEITEYALKLNIKHKKRLSLSIVTNLNAIDDDKFKYLVKNNIDICTSLDGPKFIHDHNRPHLNNSGSYDNVIKWITRIREEYEKKKIKRDVNALITVTKKTLDYPKAIIDEYIKQKIATIQLRFVTDLGSAHDAWKKIGYTPEEFIDFWKKSLNYIIEVNHKGKYIEERMSSIILGKIVGKSKIDYLELRSPCGAAIGQLLYNHDGGIYTCDEGRMIGEDIFRIGDVNNTYKEVLTSNQTCAIVSSSVNDCFACDNCVYKPYCGLCPVCNYAEQGSTIASVFETPRCKIYMAMFDYLLEKYFFDEKAKAVFDKWLNKQ